MKTNEHIDVAEFFKRQLEGQIIEPPVHIWEQVKQNIPTYKATTIWKNWWIYNSIAIITVLSVIIYWQFEQNKSKSKQGMYAKHSFTNIISIRSPFVSNEQSQPNLKNNDTDASVNINNKNKSNAKVQEAIYYVEVSTVGILEKVEILDSLNQKRKIFQNIVANEFGYYELNIEDLSPGKYNIILYRKDGKQIIHNEEFR